MTARLRDNLTAAGATAPVVRLAPDTWRRGRRARIDARVRAVIAATAAVLVVVVCGPGVVQETGLAVGGDGDRVPAGLDLPWMWQATVQMDPPGRASVVFGGSAFGLHGTDIFDSEGKLAVVGRGGKTRMLLYAGVGTITSGEDVLLSPDGTRIASSFLPDLVGEGLVVTDLATGTSRAYPGTEGDGSVAPVAWAPDGRSLLITQTDSATDNTPAFRYLWLDLDTGRTHVLSDYTLGPETRTTSRGAFAPDGRRVALTQDSTVRLVDLATGHPLWSVDLGPRRHLAGIGAFIPDGSRIATVTLDGCADICDAEALGRRQWRIGYLDAATGADASGPSLPVVTGSALRALGWTASGELVALAYEPWDGTALTADNAREWSDTGWVETHHVRLIALRPDGTTATLLDPPDGVLNLDVAADLIAAGRFGGPSSYASVFPARSIIWIAIVPLSVALFIAVLITVVVVRARRPRRPHPRSN